MATKRHIYGVGLSALVLGAAFTLLPSGQAEASSYYYPSYTYPTYSTYYSSNDTAARLASLLKQLQELQRQLLALQGLQGSSCSYYGTCGGSYDQYSRTDVTRVDVELFDDYADVEIRYRDGDRDQMLFDADTRAEVIDFLVDETKNSRSHLVAVTHFTDGDEDDDNDIDDIRSIDVEIRNNDARVEVRYEDGERDTFTVDETDEDDIIDEIADELDLDADDVDDLVDFDDESDNNDDDVDSIKVTIYEDDNDATARVRFEDGHTRTYRFNTDDEDDIIDRLADELDMDDSDVEDVIDFDYED